jgi:hypothetical protein
MIQSLEKVFRQRQNYPMEYTEVCWGGFPGGNPHISPRNIVAAAIISHDKMLCKWKVKRAENGKWDGHFISYSIENIAVCTPSNTSIKNFSKEVDVKQAIIQHSHLKLVPKVALQNDGGHRERKIKLIVTFDPNNKTDTPDGLIH